MYKIRVYKDDKELFATSEIKNKCDAYSLYHTLAEKFPKEEGYDLFSEEIIVSKEIIDLDTDAF